MGSVAIKNWSVASTNLTRVVEDNDLGVEGVGTLGRVVFGVTSNVTTQDGKSSAGMLSAQDDANKHTVTVVLGADNGETGVSVTYATNK